MAHTDAVASVFIGVTQTHDVDCIVVTDSEGRVLFDPIFGPSAPGSDDADDTDAVQTPTDAALSFVQAQRQLSHLPQSSSFADGGLTVSAQYKDNILVQFSEGPVTVTLTSRRTKGRCLGGLLAIVPLVRMQPGFKKLCAGVKIES